MLNSPFRWLTQLGVYLASPWAFAVLASYAVGWAIYGNLDLQGFATLATWLMTLFIQRAGHRDTQAIHAKLDELLHVQGEARDALCRLDDKEPEEIEDFRKHERERSSD